MAKTRKQGKAEAATPNAIYAAAEGELQTASQRLKAAKKQRDEAARDYTRALSSEEIIISTPEATADQITDIKA
jgi:hypothetical protein